MWWDRSELVDVYLSPTCIGFASGSVSVTSWIETQDLDDGMARLAQALSQAPLQSCGRVRVWLASALARPLMLSPTSGARNRQEAKSLATMLAPDATGFDEPVRVWANAWRANRGGLAVVMSDRIWAALHHAADQARDKRRQGRHTEVARSLELVSVRPWWNQVLDVVLAESLGKATRIGWSLSEGRGVVHGIVDNGNPVEAGFDLLGAHDADGALLRRRLEVNWNAGGASKHFDFSRTGNDSVAALGCWREWGRDVA